MAEEPNAPENQEEEVEKSEETKAPQNAGGGASPWLPVLVVIIVLPILSLVVTEFVITPRIKKAVDEIAHVQSSSGHPAEGGSMPGAASHSTKKEAKKESSGGHGGGGHGGGASEDAKTKKALTFTDIVANLSGAMKTRFLKVSFMVEGEREDIADIMTENRTKLIDSTLGVLGSLTLTDLEDPGMKNIVRNDLIDAFNHVLKEHVVDSLYFSEFVVQ